MMNRKMQTKLVMKCLSLDMDLNDEDLEMWEKILLDYQKHQIQFI